MAKSRARQWADLLASTPLALDNSNRLTVGDADTASATLDIATSSGNASVEIQAPSDSHSILKFGDTADDDVGHITYDHTADYMSFTANASERMRITSAGNVGIGTTSPASKLHIKATSNSETDYPLTIENLADTLDLGIGAYGFSNTIGVSQGSDFKYNVGRDHIFQSDSVEHMRIDTNGYVGIGESNPARDLHISNSGNPIIGLQDTGGTNQYAELLVSGSSSRIFPIFFKTFCLRKLCTCRLTSNPITICIPSLVFVSSNFTPGFSNTYTLKGDCLGISIIFLNSSKCNSTRSSTCSVVC